MPACCGEDLRDGFSFIFLDLFIQIEERESELLAQQPAPV